MDNKRPNFKNKFRALLPCPDCGVDAGEYCISRRGSPMEHIHPHRRPVFMTHWENYYMARWLARFGDIFKEKPSEH